MSWLRTTRQRYKYLAVSCTNNHSPGPTNISTDIQFTMKVLDLFILSAIVGLASAAAVPAPDSIVERDGNVFEKKCSSKGLSFDIVFYVQTS